MLSNGQRKDECGGKTGGAHLGGRNERDVLRAAAGRAWEGGSANHTRLNAHRRLSHNCLIGKSLAARRARCSAEPLLQPLAHIRLLSSTYIARSSPSPRTQHRPHRPHPRTRP